MNAYDGQQILHQILHEIMKKSLKTYLKKLNMKIKIFHHNKGTGKILKKQWVNRSKCFIFIRR